jgi:hypothetical protein
MQEPGTRLDEKWSGTGRQRSWITHIVRHEAHGNVVISTTAHAISRCSVVLNEGSPCADHVATRGINKIRRGLTGAPDDGERVLKTNQATTYIQGRESYPVKVERMLR